MSVFTAFSLASLLFFTSLVSSKALPCPDCVEEPLPVFVTTTEPCPHEEGCYNLHKPTPPPVVITEHCHGNEGCNHPKPPPYTPHVLTSTISTCRKPSSIIPYTSGSTTFLFSSCMPSTMWYTQNVTCNSLPPASTIYQSITIPGATAISTSISTATVYQNGTAPPAQTITLPGSGSVLTITSYQYATTPSPLIITNYESIPATCSSVGAPEAQVMTTTIYQSGTTPPAQTIVLTSYQSGVAPPAQTTTIFQSGTPPPAQTVVLTSYESGVAPPAQTITYTSIGPGTTLPRETLVITSYASGSPPATITVVETTVSDAYSDVFLTSTLVSTTTSLTTGKSRTSRSRLRSAKGPCSLLDRCRNSYHEGA